VRERERENEAIIQIRVWLAANGGNQQWKYLEWAAKPNEANENFFFKKFHSEVNYLQI
jgi:hypothetical protein